MTFNPNHAELLGREIHRIRVQEAAQQRLIREVTLANPPLARKVWLILRDRWQSFWRSKFNPKPFPPITPQPGNSHSL